jgi:hypothetical protein
VFQSQISAATFTELYWYALELECVHT